MRRRKDKEKIPKVALLGNRAIFADVSFTIRNVFLGTFVYVVWLASSNISLGSLTESQ